MNNRIFLIDICGTLFRSNTTFDFAKFYYSEARWYKVINCVKHIKVARLVNYLIFKIFHTDLMRKYIILHLRGLKKEELINMTEVFFNDFLKSRINCDIVNIINEQRDKGVRLVIVSATLDCISKVVAKKFNIDIQFSSQLEYDNDVCQGFLQNDLLGCKLETLKKNGLKPPYYGIITDNYSDIDIIQNSNQAFLIQYSNKKDRWTTLEKEMKNCRQTKVYIDKIMI